MSGRRSESTSSMRSLEPGSETVSVLTRRARSWTAEAGTTSPSASWEKKRTSRPRPASAPTTSRLYVDRPSARRPSAWPNHATRGSAAVTRLAPEATRRATGLRGRRSSPS